MSTDNNFMKGSKPPPPVPPRPSKTLIKEALAKTRQAHGIYVNSVPTLPTSQNHDKSPTRSPQQALVHPPQEPETNSILILGRQNALSNKATPSRKIQFDNNNARPVIYQSENCKNRVPSPEITKTCGENNNQNSTDQIKSACVPDDFTGKIPTLVAQRYSGLKNEHILDRKVGGYTTISDPKRIDTEFWKQKLRQKNNESDTGRKISLDEEVVSTMSNGTASPDCNKSDTMPDKNWDDTLGNKNHVNTLIDEMFASVLEVNLSTSTSPSSSSESIIRDIDNKVTISNSNSLCNKSNSDDNLTVISINEQISDKRVSESSETKSTESTAERKVTFNDRQNHEFLINELQNMKHHEDKILKRQRLSPLQREEDDSTIYRDDTKIQMNDWYGVNEGKKVRMSSCHIQIDDLCENSPRIPAGQQKIKNISREYGLPPLPKSLSGFNFMDISRFSQIRRNNSISDHFDSTEEANNDEDVPSTEKTNLHRQLAILRREMDSLREQDLFLLSKLWFLNESIQDFRQILQDQEEKSNLTSPSPTPSSVDDEEFYVMSTSTC